MSGKKNEKFIQADSIDWNNGNFPESGCLPVMVQDASSGKVLMAAYMNQAAYETTVATGKVTFYSRSKQRLWTKGEVSGHFLHLVSVKLDCDGDCLLVTAHPEGPTCHLGTGSCFDGVLADSEKAPLTLPTNAQSFFYQLEKIIEERRTAPEGERPSYTASLFKAGLDKVAQKVGEEAIEVVIESKNQHRELFLNEVSDLFYHLLVLLNVKNVALNEIEGVLSQRHSQAQKGAQGHDQSKV